MKISFNKNKLGKSSCRNAEFPLRHEGELESLYIESGDKLFHVALKLVNDTEVAKGIVQKVFSDIWAKRENLKIEVPIEAYLIKAIKFSAIDHIRAKAVRQKFQEDIKATANLAHNDTEEQLDVVELKNQIGRMVNLLPSKCQQVYRLSREKYMSNREIALGLQISEKTVERHITKALGQLRKGLENS